MSRIFHRAAAIVAGMALPLSAWALVAPANVDEAYVNSTRLEVVKQVVAEDSPATVELQGSIEVESFVSRAETADETFDAPGEPEASTTGCCVWVYYHGMWYCFPCT